MQDTLGDEYQDSPDRLNEIEYNRQAKIIAEERKLKDKLDHELYMKNQEKIKVARVKEKEEELNDYIESEFQKAEYDIKNNEFLIENKMFRRDTALLPPLS